MSPKRQLNTNVTKTKIYPKRKCQQNITVTKTQMSPKCKCHQSAIVTKTQCRQIANVTKPKVHQNSILIIKKNNVTKKQMSPKRKCHQKQISANANVTKNK